MNSKSHSSLRINWSKARVGITGASGSLGCSLSKILKTKGAYVIGITHQSKALEKGSSNAPDEWVQWQCGEEEKLRGILATLDILILNHGFNPGGDFKINTLDKALQINALSTWKLINFFEKLVLEQNNHITPKEIWVNTSEAEIQPAFSPGYEISKRLIGQLVSLKCTSYSKNQNYKLKIRKLILGPFRSNLNPIGIMNSDWVANQIINQSNLMLDLIIVTPNPFTYILMPVHEILQRLYFSLLKNK